MLPEGDRARKAFETIQLAVKRGGNLVSGLLQFTRKKPALVKPLDVNALIIEQMALLAHTTLSQVTMQQKLDPTLPVVSGDDSALGLVLMNLWINGVDAMKNQDSEKILSVTTRCRGGRVEIIVSDNGPGMAEEIVSRVGEPFLTTKASGTGLGLHMAYSIVKAHGGDISVVTGPQIGTSFTISLPAAEGDSASSLAGEASATQHPKRVAKVLLVDDDADVLENTEELLSVLGCTVVSRDRGETALATLQEGQDFDLVILDMNMPGLGGLKTLAEMRRLWPFLPIAISTGLADQQVIDKAVSLPFTSLLPKPIEVSALKQLLGESR